MEPAIALSFNIAILCLSPKPHLTCGPLSSPRNLRTHVLRLLGPKTIVYKAFDLF